MLVKLKDIADIIAGQSPESRYYSDNKTDIPFLQGNRTFGIKYPTIDTYTSKVTKMAQKGDVLISVRAPVGDLNIANMDLCIGRGLASMKAKDGNNEFLYYALKANMNNIVNKGNGTTYDSITADVIKNAEISIPDDQNIRKRVSYILSSFDDQIERNNRMVQSLQVLGKTIYDNFAKNQEEFINIQDASDITWGQCPEGNEIFDIEVHNSIRYASGAGDIDDNVITISPKGFTTNSRRIAKKYDICISVAGTVGKICVVDEELSIGRAMLSFRNESIFGYLYFALLKYSEPLRIRSSGAVQKIINNEHLKILDIPNFDDNIVIKLNALLKQCLKIEKNTKNLQRLKNSLLPLLINGQLQ